MPPTLIANPPTTSCKPQRKKKNRKKIFFSEPKIFSLNSTPPHILCSTKQKCTFLLCCNTFSAFTYAFLPPLPFSNWRPWKVPFSVQSERSPKLSSHRRTRIIANFALLNHDLCHKTHTIEKHGKTKLLEKFKHLSQKLLLSWFCERLWWEKAAENERL